MSRITIEERLQAALIAAGNSALGMPGTVDAFREWLRRAGLDLTIADPHSGRGRPTGD